MATQLPGPKGNIRHRAHDELDRVLTEKAIYARGLTEHFNRLAHDFTLYSDGTTYNADFFVASDMLKKLEALTRMVHALDRAVTTETRLRTIIYSE